jgi:hypothetical protein
MLSRRLATATLIGLWTALLPVSAAPPQLVRITPPALQPGVPTILTLDGADLLPNPRLLLPVPMAAQVVKDKPAGNRVQVEVKLANGVAPGPYPLRLVTDKGTSHVVPLVVDDLPSQPFAASVAKVPASLYGELPGSTTLSTSFAGKKGQRIVIEIEARRLGSAIDPVVKLSDPRRVQLAWAQGSTALGGDARLATVLPADGTYTVEIHDLQYQAGAPSLFRLRLGDFQYADLPFPLAGRRGTKAKFELLGSFSAPLRVEADLSGAVSGSFVRLPHAPGLSGAAPHVLVSDIAELTESEMPGGKLQELTPPMAISGRLGVPGKEARYRVRVRPGMRLRFDVLAERAGSPLDGVLVLSNEAGTPLARSDDQPGTLDPGLEYTVPGGITTLIAAVTDVQGRGGPLFVYRLAVMPAGLPDFSLTLSEDRVQVPRNGVGVLRVHAVRTGYDGRIKLSLPGLPAGLSVSGDQIPAGATDTLLTLTPVGTAKQVVSVLPRVTGASTDPKVPLQRVALTPETPLTRAQPWLRSDVAVAITDGDGLGIAWDSTTDDLPIGAQLAARVKLTRSAEAKGLVRLTLFTSQVIPKVQGTTTDDVNRALRLEGMPTILAGRTQADLKILVPANLPVLPYDVAVRAELLAADGRTVVATAVTPARRLAAAR